MAIHTFEDIKTVGENKIIYGYVSDDQVPNSKKLVYEINKDKKIITFHPYSNYYFFDRITLNGFSALPEIFQKKGFSKNKILDYVHRLFKDKGIKTITVNRTGNATIVKRGRDKHLHLPYRSLSRLSDEIGSMNFLHRNRRSKFVNKHFNSELPSLIKLNSSSSSQDEIKNAIQILKSQNTENFNNENIDKITDVLSSLMKGGHKSYISKSKLFKNTKLKFDTVTLSEVILITEVQGELGKLQ